MHDRHVGTIAMRMPLPVAGLFGLCGLLAQGAHAADVLGAVKQRGFEASKVYASSSVDSVNTFNGNLVVRIPIGQEYALSSGLSYGLVLSYNEHAWDAQIGQGIINDLPSTVPEELALNVPMGDANAGLGWKVSLGELYPPAPPAQNYLSDHNVYVNERPDWMYVSADGARHYFRPILHPDSTAGQYEAVSYTSDGTYLRMRAPHGRERIVDMPDGTHHVFECRKGWSPNDIHRDGCWKLTRIEDAYVRGSAADAGGVVDVSYAADGSRTTITDSTGRQHFINFAEEPSDSRYARVVSSVDLAASRDQRAVYTFDITSRMITRGCTPTVTAAYRMVNYDGDGDPTGFSAVIPEIIPVPVLDGMTLPDGSTYTFSYMLQSVAGGTRCVDDNGRLESMVLPTGKRIEWSYGLWTWLSGDCTWSPDSGTVPGVTPYIPMWQGIVEKREYASETATAPEARWLYLAEASAEQMQNISELPQHVCFQVPRQFATTVIDPLGHATVHYYNTYREDHLWGGTGADTPDKGSTLPGVTGWTDAEFGINASRYRFNDGLDVPGWSPAQQRLYISTEFYSCPPGHDPQDQPWGGIDDFVPSPVNGCTLERQTYRRFEQDLEGYGFGGCTDALQSPVDCTDSNRRMLEEKTVFVDDPRDGEDWRSTRHYDFDGFGNFRQSATGGNLSGSPTAHKTTQYNDRRERDEVPPPEEAWLLGLYTHVTRQRGAETVRTEYCFDPNNGFLHRVRVLKNFGTTRDAHDLVTQFVPVRASDNGIKNGELEYAKYFGGDDASIATGGCNDASFDTQQPAYVQSLQYSFGQLARTAFVAPDDFSKELLRTSRSTVDRNTGLAIETFDVSGVQTAGFYDALGRMTSVQTGGLPLTEYGYCLATKPGCDGQNRVTGRTHQGALELGNAAYVYDASGQMTSESVTTPLTGSATAVRRRLTRYDAAGNVIEQTPWRTNPQLNPAGSQNNNQQNYLYAFDPLGRTVRETKPDQSLVRYSYDGARRTSKEVRIEVAADQQAWTEVRSFYDEEGRLVQVNDFAHGAAARQDQNTFTYYAYDVNGKLDFVQFDGSDVAGDDVRQERHYDHDAVGRLRTERIPELGRLPNGTPATLQYVTYDALGKVLERRSNDGVRSLHDTYDRAARLVQTHDGDPVAGGRLLAEVFYGTRNQGGDLRLGKVVMIKRHNYLPVDPADPTLGQQDWVVRETRRYVHPAGMQTATAIRTARLSGATHQQGGVAFDSSQSYLATGEIDTLGYPGCAMMGCDMQASPARTIAYKHSYGAVVEVSNVVGADRRALARFGYHASGATNTVSHLDSNGAQTALETFTADPSGMIRPLRIGVTGAGGATLWTSNDYLYDGAGNIRGIGTDRFTYDKVGRLRSAQVGGAPQNASYDAFGNIASLSAGAVERTFALDSSSNRLASSAQVAYDPYGNITRWHGRTLGFDAVDMPVYASWSEAGGSLRKGYVYAPGEHRIATVDYDSGVQHWRLRSAQGPVLREVRREVGGGMAWERDYVRSAGRLVTSFERAESGERERRYHIDHVGSTRLVTDAAGAVVAQYAFFPFGEFAQSSGAESEQKVQLFTGHERDRNAPGTTDDLDYMLARYYAPAYGRFLSLDKATGAATDPQTWNRYAYVRNNPMTRVDPTGLVEQEVVEIIIDDYKTGNAGLTRGQRTARDGMATRNLYVVTSRGAALPHGTVVRPVEFHEVHLDKSVIDSNPRVAAMNPRAAGNAAAPFGVNVNSALRGSRPAATELLLKPLGADGNPARTGGMRADAVWRAASRGGADDVSRVVAGAGSRAGKSIPGLGYAMAAKEFAEADSNLQRAGIVATEVADLIPGGGLALEGGWAIGTVMNESRLGRRWGGAFSDWLSDRLCGCAIEDVKRSDGR